jgi:hypothetical protein
MNYIHYSYAHFVLHTCRTELRLDQIDLHWMVTVHPMGLKLNVHSCNACYSISLGLSTLVSGVTGVILDPKSDFWDLDQITCTM